MKGPNNMDYNTGRSTVFTVKFKNVVDFVSLHLYSDVGQRVCPNELFEMKCVISRCWSFGVVVAYGLSYKNRMVDIR